MKEESEIEINLNSLKKGLKIWIRPKIKGTLFDGVDTLIDNNEPRFQLIEGCFYDYAISDDNFILGDVGSNIIYRHQLKQNIGTISPNTFVGTLEIPVFKTDERKRIASISLEVQSVKSEYLEDYGEMLEFITEKCADYLLEFNSPVIHHFDLELPKDSQKLYQMFSFIKSIISSTEFTGAIHKILTTPIAKWSQVYEPKDLRSSRKFSNSNLKELIRGGERIKIPRGHHLRDFGLETITKRITSVQKIDSVDTPENRFVKHALHTFLKVFSEINTTAAGDSKLHSESGILINQIESHLNHFNCSEISKPVSLKLNSPILQRKEGYYEVLRTWLRFELAVKFKKFDVSNKNVLILGAGGVVPSLIGALNKMKTSNIMVSNRTKVKAENLKKLFKNINIIDWGDIPNFDLVINATSVGLKKEDKINLDFSNVGKNKFFYDIIYNPNETSFLKMAEKLGNKTENGKMMFIYQALASFKIWHGISPKIDDSVLKLLDQ